MKKNRDRRSYRLHGYDYSSEGLYFISGKLKITKWFYSQSVTLPMNIG